MKFVLANDLHLSLKNPVSRTDNYHETMMGKMDQLYKLALKLHAAAILLAGDIFNQKTGVPLRLWFDIYTWCVKVKSAGIRVIAIPGNHDLENDRYDSLLRQPLGLLFLGGAMEDASFRTISVGEVDVVGIPYPAAKHRSLYDNLPQPAQRRSILMCHCFATVEGGEYFGEPILPYSSLLNLPFDVFHIGHDHSDHGVSKLNDKWFVNVGALSRGSISVDNISRDVKCGIVDITETGTEVIQVKLQVKPAGDIFDLALRAQKERERSDIERFVGDLQEGLADVKPVDFKEKLTTIEMPEKVRTRVLMYIEQAESSS